MHLQLAPAPLRMAPRLHLALELPPGEVLQQAHQLLDQPTMHPRQGDHTRIFQLHMAVLRLLQHRLQLPDMETKRQHQQRPRERIENHCGTTGLTLPHHDTTPQHQLQAHRHRLHMEVVTMHLRQRLGLETAQGILTAMKSNRGWVLQIGNHCLSILWFAASPNLASYAPARERHLAAGYLLRKNQEQHSG
jgi:hypothetical protein